MRHVPIRNMRLVIGLLESIPEDELTDVEWEMLNSMVLSARLLASSLLTHDRERIFVQETGDVQKNTRAGNCDLD